MQNHLALLSPGLNTFPAHNQGVAFPLPLLHPHTARLAENHLGLPRGALLALARGEAWWQRDHPTLPPGRSFSDGLQAPLWQWPPPLVWPPPRPNTPAWRTQAITLNLTTTQRSGWQHGALSQTGAAGLQALQRCHPWVPLLDTLPLPSPSPRAHNMVQRRDELARLIALDAPASVLRPAHRNLQLAVEAVIAEAGAITRSAA